MLAPGSHESLPGCSCRPGELQEMEPLQAGTEGVSGFLQTVQELIANCWNGCLKSWYFYLSHSVVHLDSPIFCCCFWSQVHCTGRLSPFLIPWQNIFVNYSADSSIDLEAFFPPALCVFFLLLQLYNRILNLLLWSKTNQLPSRFPVAWPRRVLAVCSLKTSTLFWPSSSPVKCLSTFLFFPPLSFCIPAWLDAK